MAKGALEDGVALLDKLACIVILRGNRPLDLPVMAQGGEGFRFRLLALRADIGGGAGEGAGGGSGVSRLSIVFTGRSTGSVDQVVDRVVVGDGVPFGGGDLRYGDVFVSVGDGCRIAGFQGHLVTAV